MDVQGELNGSLTLSLLCVLAMGVYSGAYSFGSASVPMLEMWMIWTQTLSAMACTAFHFVSTSTFGSPVRHLSAALISLFAGVALTATMAGVECLNAESSCKVFFSGSIFPKASAAAAMGWAWVAYLSSCTLQFSLGLENLGVLTILSVPCIFLNLTERSLVQTCKWTSVCSSGGNCATPAVFGMLFAALLLAHVGNSLAASQWSKALKGLSLVFMLILFIVVVPDLPLWLRVLGPVLASLSLGYSAFVKKEPTTTTTTGAGFKRL